MYRFKVEIVIDEEKVIKDDKYEPQVMYDYIRDMFKQFELPEIKTEEPYHLIFTDKGGNKDLGAMGRIVFDLCDMDWFRKYATEFYWYELNMYGKPFKTDVFNEFYKFQNNVELNDEQKEYIEKIIKEVKEN